MKKQYHKRIKVELWHPPYRGPSDSARTNSRDTAELLAGEWLLANPESMVFVGKGWKRWRLVLRDDYTLRWTALYSDGIPEVPAAIYERRRLRSYVRLVEEQEQRRQARKTALEKDREEQRHERANKFCQGVRRPVVCLDTARAFETVVEAAAWLGVKQHSTLVVAIQRGRRCGTLRWQYADILLKELEHESQQGVCRPADHGEAVPQSEGQSAARPNHAALRAVAQHALSLRQRPQVQKVPRENRARVGVAQAEQVKPPQ